VPAVGRQGALGKGISPSYEIHILVEMRGGVV